MRSGKEPDKKQMEELLAELKKGEPLAPFNLTLYGRERENEGDPHFRYCCAVIENPLCRDLSRQFFESGLDAFFRENTPTVCRYGGGFFGFVVPFPMQGHDFCLVGDGVRDDSVDLWQLAAFTRPGGKELFSLLPMVESVPAASFEAVDRVAREVARCIAERTLCGRKASGEVAGSGIVDTRLLAVANTLEQLEAARTVAETVGLCCETIGDQFDIAKMALALRRASGAWYQVSGVRGLPEDLGAIPSEAAAPFLAWAKTRRVVPLNDQMRGALPALQATLCACFPLRSQGEALGFIALLDCDLHEAEMLLISMLANATAAKLMRILKEAEQSKAVALSGRLMSLANTLLQVENKEQLYEAILGIAADLIDATQGSIMLIDKNGETMHIVFTKGMTLNVARSLDLKVGKGIAGRVAQIGEPLLVDDVEKDARVSMPNRPRFLSKSLISIPLKLKEKIIGVLNLSDKRNLAPFSYDDLQLLTSFSNLASLMIERSLVLEESVRFEQLSVTDSLTGLYNRRFLKGRLEEELNRSIRQGLNLTVIFIDLDFFKNYNDFCGHIAGDHALKKTGEIIRASLRDMDVVARYGGEEFCAVLPGTSKSEALIVAERIRAEIEKERFDGESDIPHRRITASLGVASFPEDGRTFTELVHASDVALYQAKANGRNCIVAACPPPPAAPPPLDAGADPMGPEDPPSAKTLDFNAYLEATIVPGLDEAQEGKMAQTQT